jgi:hypothetical protein
LYQKPWKEVLAGAVVRAPAGRMRGNLAEDMEGIGWNRYRHHDTIDGDSQNLVSGLLG